MKYCLNMRLSSKYLEKADEIKINSRDCGSIPEVIDKYPDKDIILQIKDNDKIDWKELYRYNILSKNHLILCLSNTELFSVAKESGIRYYCGYPVENFYELRALEDAGVCYIRVGMGLFFNMNYLKDIKTELRAVPNVAYIDGLKREDGVCGQWIRPEDLALYEPYITAVEFEGCLPEKEEALYRIYAEQHVWPGELGMIIENLNHLCVNRMIDSNVTNVRLSCGQKCQKTGNCKICYRAFELANTEKIKDYVSGEKTPL